MVQPGDTVLAAVSGGPDSIFLLQALACLKNKLKIKEIVVASLDHGLRGKASANDSLVACLPWISRLAAFCQHACRRTRMAAAV